MSSRRAAQEADTDVPAVDVPTTGLPVHAAPHAGLVQRRHLRTRAEVEQRYVEARDAWTAAMKAASSGKAADLAVLALAQEAYETAAAERQRWESGARVAIPIEPETPHPDLGAVIGQELAWRRIHSVAEKPVGLLGRLRRRLLGR